MFEKYSNTKYSEIIKPLTKYFISERKIGVHVIITLRVRDSLKVMGERDMSSVCKTLYKSVPFL